MAGIWWRLLGLLASLTDRGPWWEQCQCLMLLGVGLGLDLWLHGRTQGWWWRCRGLGPLLGGLGRW
jgi:hypothetical protein